MTGVEEAAERDLAAALVVALEVGLIATADAVRVVDREILARPSPGTWLIQASLAKSSEGMLLILRGEAGGHPMLADVWVLLDVMSRALDSGASAMDIAPRVKRVYPYGEWPRELSQLLYDVYEEVTCAHDRGGVPQPEHVDKALRVLLAQTRGRNAWHAALDQVTA